MMTAACSPEAVTCAVRTGVPIHVTFLPSMSQWPAQLPVLFSATGWLCPRSSPESHRKWADRSHSSLRVELEDRIKGLMPALPQRRPFIYRQLTNILLPLRDETWKDTTVNACFKRKCIPWSVEDQERDFQRVRIYTVRLLQTLGALWLKPFHVRGYVGWI